MLFVLSHKTSIITLITHKEMRKTQNKCEKLKDKSKNDKILFATEMEQRKKDGGLVINPQKCFTICSARLVSDVLM